MEKINTITASLNWELVGYLQQIDRFDAQWSSIEKREGQSLKHLKSVATVKSTGASTRIEGSIMSDEEVQLFLEDISIEKLEERDQQEVKGYFELLELIIESFKHIPISENSIKDLHNRLLRYSDKDKWHKGDYKQQQNNVESTLADGSKQLIFEPTPPGIETEDKMRELVQWYQEDIQTHPLVKTAVFIYEFVSIDPFQDGNGRLSRLLTTLLLLKNKYVWIQYISFENEIEHKKAEYYNVLRSCQTDRPNENIDVWITFFCQCIINMQKQLANKLKKTGIETSLSPKEKSILAYIENHPGTQSGEISTKLKIPNPSVKRYLKKLVDKKLIESHGIGKGTNYSVI